ncbi:YopX protein [Vibrio phage 1.256.O._10N.286.45.F8]|nr:YopX protein [Vibrio phage 1.256.O._10N.286.45.F8]
MSREIKFKYIWKRETSIATGVYTLEDIENGNCVAPKTKRTSWDVIARFQWTGLKDKKCNDIFDGDICEIMYYTPFGDKTDDFYGKWQVKRWMGQFILISGKERLSFTDFADVKSSEYVSNLGTVVGLSDVVNVKVIGNIHQNPELLK